MKMWFISSFLQIFFWSGIEIKKEEIEIDLPRWLAVEFFHIGSIHVQASLISNKRISIQKRSLESLNE